MNSNLKRPLFRLINQKTKGIDLYDNNGSMWLIFTDRKKWVIELTKDGTLWYNYYFFQDCFKYLSLDVVENQHFITEWVESIIQNGVRDTAGYGKQNLAQVEDTIQNGVRNTQSHWGWLQLAVEDIIQNGVRETKHNPIEDSLAMEEVIQNGVKHTEYGDWEDGDERLDEIIQNGIKETRWRRVDNHPTFVDCIIEIKNPS
jgi:hypothetical protein